MRDSHFFVASIKKEQHCPYLLNRKTILPPRQGHTFPGSFLVSPVFLVSFLMNRQTRIYRLSCHIMPRHISAGVSTVASLLSANLRSESLLHPPASDPKVWMAFRLTGCLVLVSLVYQEHGVFVGTLGKLLLVSLALDTEFAGFGPISRIVEGLMCGDGRRNVRESKRNTWAL